VEPEGFEPSSKQ